MLRELFHIIPIKNTVEQAVNCWLSYTLSQPINVDLAVVGVFIIQYVGFDYIKELISQIRATNALNRKQ